MPDLWFDVDAALAEVPVNIMPLLDDTDFKTREVAVAYDASGMDLVWNFVTPAGAYTQTAVTPTSAGNYDWAHVGDGMYTIEIPASGGASINNDTEGFGWFTGVVTGVLPWRGPIIGFRDSDLNDKLIESAWSATRGLSGTALPDAAADAAGGLPISDAGGLDLDTQIGTDIDAILADTGTDGVVLANDAITSAKIAANAIGSSEIADGAITAAKIATGAIDADALAADFTDEIWDEVMTGTTTGRQTQMLSQAVLAGKASGMDTGSPIFRNIADTTDVVAATTDSDGNRTAVTITYP